MQLIKLVRTSVLTVALSYTVIPMTFAKDVVIGLSPFYSSETRITQVKQSLKFATELAAGDRVIFMDAYHLEHLGVFTIPEKKAYASAKARMAFNRKTNAGIMRFAKQPPQADNPPSVEGTVRLPQFLRHVSQNIQGDEQVDVVILGSPFYAATNDPTFSMAEGVIPNDGHLQVSRDKSVYGIAGQDNALKHLRVHLAYGNATMLSDRHTFRVERFWQLFVTQQSGQWVSFVRDYQTAFNRIKSKAPALPNPHQMQETQRLEMIRLQGVKVESSIHDRPLATVKLTPKQIREAKNVEIGITWDCGRCDLDLHVRPLPHSPTLSYRHTRSNVGMYYKDFTRSPEGTGGFETVMLKVPVDLRATVIAVNFFSGTVKESVKGHIRLSVDGKTYAKPFTISAQRGKSGRAVDQAIASGKSRTPQVLLINPLSIIQH